jgi:hypothetical protein
LRAGYIGQDGVHYQLYLTKSIVLRIDEPQAICTISASSSSLRTGTISTLAPVMRATIRFEIAQRRPPITYAVVLDTGDEVIGELGKFVREQKVEAASLTAIGAFSRVVLGFDIV